MVRLERRGSFMMYKECFICRKLLTNNFSWALFSFKVKNSIICNDCRSKLQTLVGPFCRKCSRMLQEIPENLIHDDLCHDCYLWEKHSMWKDTLDSNKSLYSYNDFMKEIIARFKYRGDLAIAEVFGEDIKTYIVGKEFDMFVPIPLSDIRMNERGFNQSEVLIHMAGLTPTEALIRKNSEKQSKKTKKERLEVSGLFEILDNIDVNRKNILIIDDIYTTGATIRNAALELKKAGANRIESLTIAR